MTARTRVAIAVMSLAAAAIGVAAANRNPSPSDDPVSRDVPAPRVEPTPPVAHVSTPLGEPAAPLDAVPDVVAWYDSVRDDPDPKLRLRVIEAWARDARRDDGFDLLTHALVDPDASVRERAQELFERRMTQR